MIGRRLAILVAAALLLTPGARAGEGGEAPLPADPEVVRGRLDNGVRYLIKPHDLGSRRAWIRLVVEAGSLHEQDQERGAADLIRRLAYTATDDQSTGQIKRTLRDLGISTQDDERYTDFVHTLYTLPLTDADEASIGATLDVLAGVVGGLRLEDEEINRARGEAIEEYEIGRPAHARVWAELMPKLTSGSRLARRTSMAPPAALRALTPEAVRSYYERRYRSGAASIVIVGDVDPAAVEPVIRKSLSPLPAREAPPTPSAGLEPYDGAFGAVVTDRGLPGAVVAVVRVGPGGSGVRTVEDRREALLRDLAKTAVERHLSRCGACPDKAYRDPGAYLGPAFMLTEVMQVQADVDPGSWREGMIHMVSDLRWLVENGVPECDLQVLKENALTDAAGRAEKAPTAPAHKTLRLATHAVTAGEPIPSASQDLQLVRELLPAITLSDVNAALRREFDLTHAAYVVEGPLGADAPDEATILAAAREALSKPLAAPDLDQRVADAAGLLPAEPPAGRPVEMTIEPVSGTLSAWLESGALVHHRRMEQRPQRVAVAITLAGGQIEESPAQRGLTSAAATAFRKPATKWLSGLQMRDAMAERGVDLQTDVRLDSVTLRLEASTDDLEEAMRIARALLMSPRVEPAALESWRASELERWRVRQEQPTGALDDAFSALLHPPDDRRIFPLTKREIERVSLDRAQAWLDRLVREAPLEAAIVGDVSRSEAIGLGAKYLGSLTQRERISGDTLDERRTLARRKPPYFHRETVKTPEKHAAVVVARFGVDASEHGAARALQVASEVMDQRLEDLLEARPRLAIKARGFSSPARVFPGFGLFGAWAMTEPDRADEAAAALRETLDRLIQAGVAEGEAEFAVSHVADRMEAKMSDPAVWAARLAKSRYKDVPPQVIAEDAEAVRSLTAAEIEAALRTDVDLEGDLIRIIIEPAPADCGNETPED